jgi:lipid-binding SYLF domain-containing protein
MKMRFATILALTGLVVFAGAAAAKPDRADVTKKLADCGTVYTELVSSTDHAIPQELIKNARAIAIIPHVVKAAIGVGARHGDGVIVTRTASGWSAPVFLEINGGSFGPQFGVEATDLVLFFMNDNGAKSLIQGSKITLGGKASIAAGPFGRSGEAATNLELHSEIYSYARSKGLFAGLSLEGAKLSIDKDDITTFYGADVPANDLLFGNGPATMPEEVDTFHKVLP